MPSMRRNSVAAGGLVLAAITLTAVPANAATLEVGPGRALTTPSAAAKVAQDGDTVAIDPGDYYDCAIWTQNHLTIVGTGVGTGPGATITDTSCQNKGLFITTGDDITIRNLTFARARVPERNGAGIRAEGRNLTVESSRFINNEDGLLDGGQPDSTLRIIDCTFTANGVRDFRSPTPALSVGAGVIMHVERSHFADSRGGADIISAAARTELAGNRFDDGDPGVRDALIVLTNGGTLTMEDNTLRRGPSAARFNAAVRADGAAGELAFRRNTLVNASGRPAALLLDWTQSETSFTANVLQPDDVERSTEGYWRHQAIGVARVLYSQARHLADTGLRAARSMLP